MKNKRLTYFLIPLVLVIWGLIFYKIFNWSGDTDPSGIYKETSKKTESNQGKDTFSIKVNYRDPFLSGHQRSVTKSEPENSSAGFSRKKEPKPEIIIPDLKYFGLIVNANKKQKLGLFRLNNKDVILKEGELIESFKIVRLYNDSAKTTYGKIKKTFKKNTNQN